MEISEELSRKLWITVKKKQPKTDPRDTLCGEAMYVSAKGDHCFDIPLHQKDKAEVLDYIVEREFIKDTPKPDIAKLMEAAPAPVVIAPMQEASEPVTSAATVRRKAASRLRKKITVKSKVAKDTSVPAEG